LEIQLEELRSWVETWEFQALNDSGRTASTPADTSAALRGDTLHSVPCLITLIETAGGAFSPISGRHTNFDLAGCFEDAAWLLVGPDALGVLHDMMTTLETLRTRGREPNWVVLSESRSDASTGTNATELRRLGIANPCAVLERSVTQSAAPLAKAVLAWARDRG
jgi:dethiobiotin synthetase